MSGRSVGHVSLELRQETGQESPDIEPDIRPREITTKDGVEFRFDVAAQAAGFTTDVAKAALFEVSDRTLRRARAGQLGKDFMAKTVKALMPFRRSIAKEGIEVSLDGLFEVAQ